MWRKKLRKLIPDHLQYLFSETEHNGENESRQFGFEAETIELKREPQPQTTSKGQEYLLELWNSITKREQEVVALVCLGHRNYEIAEILGITPGTVKSHLENIFHKWDFPDRHAIRLALRDWDFKLWWEVDRHMLPLQHPKTR